MLNTARILGVVDLSKEFEVYTDACKNGVGEVLSQEGRVIAYESKKLKEHAQSYLTYDLELTAVVHELRIWIHYLLGKRFVLRTDHSSLIRYFKQADMNARQARWNAFLSELDFDIQHVKCKEDRVADALRRKLHGIYELYFNHIEFKFQE